MIIIHWNRRTPIFKQTQMAYIHSLGLPADQQSWQELQRQSKTGLYCSSSKIAAENAKIPWTPGNCGGNIIYNLVGSICHSFGDGYDMLLWEILRDRIWRTKEIAGEYTCPVLAHAVSASERLHACLSPGNTPKLVSQKGPVYPTAKFRHMSSCLQKWLVGCSSMQHEFMGCISAHLDMTKQLETLRGIQTVSFASQKLAPTDG